MKGQRGLSVVEALVASAVLALGLTGALRLGSQALQLGTESREQMQARLLAQNLLECQALPWPDCPSGGEQRLQGTLYRIEFERLPDPALPLDRLQVTVRWQGVLPAVDTATDVGTGMGTGEMRLQLWRQVARVPRWVGVSSP